MERESLVAVGIVIVHLLVFAASAAILIFLPYTYGTRTLSLRPSMETLLKDDWQWVIIRGLVGGALGLIFTRIWWKRHT